MLKRSLMLSELNIEEIKTEVKEIPKDNSHQIIEEEYKNPFEFEGSKSDKKSLKKADSVSMNVIVSIGCLELDILEKIENSFENNAGLEELVVSKV